MSRPKRKKMQQRLKREINKMMISGLEKKPSRELVRLSRLYNVSLTKYHHTLFKKIDA